MADYDNAVVAEFEPADEVTGYCVAAVTGGRFIKVNRDLGAQGGIFGTENIQVSLCDATAHPIAVARYDMSIAGQVPMLMGHQIIPMKAGAAVAAGAALQSDANGQPITLAAGPKAAVALSAAAALNDVILVKLMLG